jgi:mannose-6-phosphate isomerase-like protein (cupin superfamily)
VTLAHWDDVEKVRRDYVNIHGLWTYLGEAAGSRVVGVRRIELAPGEIPTPAHVHSDEEEIFFVLAGSGLSWQDGETYEIGPGDCLVHHAREQAHTLRAGAEGLDVTHGVNILLADTAEAFAVACLLLLEQPDVHQRIAVAARELVTSRFSWEKVTQCFEHILQSTCVA